MLLDGKSAARRERTCSACHSASAERRVAITNRAGSAVAADIVNRARDGKCGEKSAIEAARPRSIESILAWARALISRVAPCLSAPAEPAAHCQALARGRQHLVLEALGDKADEYAAFLHDIAHALREMHAPRAALVGRPSLVQIERARNDAGVVVPEPVAMPAIEGAGRIQRVVGLERSKRA